MQVSLNQAIAKLKAGEVVAIPTETVYGLAGDATNESALRQIYAIKERPADNPLIVHISDLTQVEIWASAFSALAQKLAQAFWPGPLTLVLPANPSVSAVVRADQPTVALRVPSHPLTLQLLKESGLALAAPSANKYTQLSPTTAAHVTAGLGDNVAVLNGGACQVGIESTIVSVTGENWQLLRYGMISEQQIALVAGRLALVDTLHLPKAPGQHQLHYSPKTRLKLFDNYAALIDYQQKSPHPCAVLMIDDSPPALNADVNCIQLPKNAAYVAEHLYEVLHRLDGLNLTQLLVLRPPHTPEWSAILDRLNRAAQSD